MCKQRQRQQLERLRIVIFANGIGDVKKHFLMKNDAHFVREIAEHGRRDEEQSR